jgi:hypothetical protein
MLLPWHLEAQSCCAPFMPYGMIVKAVRRFHLPAAFLFLSGRYEQQYIKLRNEGI